MGCKNKWYSIFISIIIILFCGIAVVVNYTYAGMSIIGCCISLIGLIVFLLYIIYKNPKYCVVFFFLNTLIGPFFIVNLSFLGYPNLGRLDYLIGFTTLIFSYKREKSKSVRRFVWGLLALLGIFWAWNLAYGITTFDEAYGYTAGLGIAYATYKCIYDIKTNNKVIGKTLYYILQLHIILSLLQLFFPIYLRTNSIEAALRIGNIIISRPIGLLANAYVYGINTMFAVFIVYETSDEVYKRKIMKLLPVMLAVSFISTRAIIIGIMLYVILTIVKSERMRKLYMLLLFLGIIGTLWYTTNNYSSVLYLADTSNASKLVLWGNCINEFFTSSSLPDIIFGRGVNSALDLSRSARSFMNSLGVSVPIDNRITDTNAFPLHNEYLQVLYEAGIIIFIYYVSNTFKAIKKSIGIKKLSTLLLCIAVTNYFFHNGFISDILIFSIIIVFREHDDLSIEENRVNVHR